MAVVVVVRSPGAVVVGVVRILPSVVEVDVAAVEVDVVADTATVAYFPVVVAVAARIDSCYHC